MSKKESNSASLPDKKLALEICDFLEGKKASNILLLDLHKVNSYFNYFIIASANSVLHLSSLAQEMSKGFAKNAVKNNKSSGKRRKHSNKVMERQNLPVKDSHSGWVILDLVDIVIHLFLEEQRSFYKLERLWGDADIFYPKGAGSRLTI